MGRDPPGTPRGPGGDVAPPSGPPDAFSALGRSARSRRSGRAGPPRRGRGAPRPTAGGAPRRGGGDVSGRVILIGAGPGDPELITVKGARALGEADVVVFDRLVAPALLDLSRPDAERLYVGKEPGRAAVPQERICSLLVEHAMWGQVVARLKGGDPLVFGRGGEELLACARAGIPCEVIPGITSAVAAPAAVALGRVATAADTLVLLMAAGKLETTCRALIAAGRPSDEPAAIIQWATTPEERRVIATLEELPVLATAAGIGPPATLVVGAVASIPAQAAALAAPLTQLDLGGPHDERPAGGQGRHTRSNRPYTARS